MTGITLVFALIFKFIAFTLRVAFGRCRGIVPVLHMAKARERIRPMAFGNLEIIQRTKQ